MTQKELEQKVIDAEGRVAKREAVLKKHNSQLAKMIEKGADRFDISIKREDIKSATSKLAEARETLANWRDKLNTRITRDAYLEANTPEILKDFLENWKQHAIGYYREKRIRFIEYAPLFLQPKGSRRSSPQGCRPAAPADERVGLRRRLGTEGRFFKVLLHPAPFLLLRDGLPGPEVAEGSRADRLR